MPLPIPSENPQPHSNRDPAPKILSPSETFGQDMKELPKNFLSEVASTLLFWLFWILVIGVPASLLALLVGLLGLIAGAFLGLIIGLVLAATFLDRKSVV